MRDRVSRTSSADRGLLVSAIVALLLAAFCSYGFLGFAQNPAAVGNELYDEGKYDEAVGKYGEALLDNPDSPVLNFNMGDAHYKAGNYEEALASFRRVRAAEDSKRQASVIYNVAAVTYRKASSLEAENPQEALKGYAETLTMYRRVLGIDPSNADAKFNYELVSRRLEDLKKKMEEEQKKQEEEQDQQQEQQQSQDENQEPSDNPQPGGEQPQDGEQQQQAEQRQNESPPGEEPPQEQAEEEQAQSSEQQQAQQQPSNDASQAQEAAAAEGEAGDEEMSPREASALVDAARNDELRPEDFIRRQQGGALAQPAQDW